MSELDGTRFTLELNHELASIPEARACLERVRELIDEVTYRNARLLVSELVTNAIRHVQDGRAVRVVVDCRSDVLRIEVHDDGPGFEPRERTDGQDPGSGWGLHLTGKLARRWGVENDGGGVVWFELALAGQAEGQVAVAGDSAPA